MIPFWEGRTTRRLEVRLAQVHILTKPKCLTSPGEFHDGQSGDIPDTTEKHLKDLG